MEKPSQVIRDVGLRIRELRGQRGWTQEAMAEKLGIALRNFQAMERGKQNLTLKTMVRLAQVLRVRTSDLLVEPSIREAPAGRPKRSTVDKKARPKPQPVAPNPRDKG